MSPTVLQEVSAVVVVLSLSVAAAIGHPGVLMGLGALLLTAGILGYWMSERQGWLLTHALGGLTSLLLGVVWFLQ